MVFRQKQGIPMGTDCAPYLANLFLFAYEYQQMEAITNMNINEARKYSYTFRYIDDLITINSGNEFNKFIIADSPRNR